MIRSLTLRPAFLCMLLLCSGTICEPPPTPPGPNESPVARLVWPQIWAVEEAVPFDASESDDSDGQLIRIAINFGDGSVEQENADGIFLHLYPAPGSFELRLTVEDDQGAVSEILDDVVLVEDLEKPSCTCDNPCFEPARCTAQGCFLSRISDDAPEEASPAPTPPEIVHCP